MFFCGFFHVKLARNVSTQSRRFRFASDSGGTQRCFNFFQILFSLHEAESSSFLTLLKVICFIFINTCSKVFRLLMEIEFLGCLTIFD